ncbi:MAG: hypothetical protein MUC36_22235 [Planctomycetes bacterium]|jgi:hypothetical protein|nr:hypothetical protein [Planctomycetota bacterium]
MRSIPLVASVLLLSVGCGGAAAAVDVAGTWAETGGAEHGHVLEFDRKSNKFLLHGPGPGGHHDHDHFEGSYRVEAGAVVLTGAWESNHKAEVVRAAIDGGTLRLDLGGKIVPLAKRP